MAPRCTQSNGFLLSLVQYVGKSNERAWILFSITTARTRISMFLLCPLVAAASTRPAHIAKRAEKAKFDRYPHVSFVPFILETTGRPGHHAKKFTTDSRHHVTLHPHFPQPVSHRSRRVTSMLPVFVPSLTLKPTVVFSFKPAPAL